MAFLLGRAFQIKIDAGQVILAENSPVSTASRLANDLTVTGHQFREQARGKNCGVRRGCTDWCDSAAFFAPDQKCLFKISSQMYLTPMGIVVTLTPKFCGALRR